MRSVEGIESIGLHSHLQLLADLHRLRGGEVEVDDARAPDVSRYRGAIGERRRVAEATGVKPELANCVGGRVWPVQDPRVRPAAGIVVVLTIVEPRVQAA